MIPRPAILQYEFEEGFSLGYDRVIPVGTINVAAV